VLEQLGAHVRLQEADDLLRIAGVDDGEGAARDDVVAEQERRLVPVRGAAGRVQERDVVGVADVPGRRIRELREPHREDGGPERVLERLPGPEVGREGERGDDLRRADRLLDHARDPRRTARR
jgi:hypothetical protein